jgi:hypothetical protein
MTDNNVHSIGLYVELIHMFEYFHRLICSNDWLIPCSKNIWHWMLGMNLISNTGIAHEKLQLKVISSQKGI